MPTVKPLPFLLMYRPRMSNPPLLHPQVSTTPPAKPLTMPPSRQLVRVSSTMGWAGTGIIVRNREQHTVQVIVRTTKPRPMVFHASISSGIFSSRYNTPDMSKPGSRPRLWVKTDRVSWQKPSRPPVYKLCGTTNRFMDIAISSTPRIPIPRRAQRLCSALPNMICSSFVYPSPHYSHFQGKCQ